MAFNLIAQAIAFRQYVSKNLKKIMEERRLEQLNKKRKKYHLFIHPPTGRKDNTDSWNMLEKATQNVRFSVIFLPFSDRRVLLPTSFKILRKMSECFYGYEQNKTLYFLKCLLQLHLLNFTV